MGGDGTIQLHAACSQPAVMPLCWSQAAWVACRSRRVCAPHAQRPQSKIRLSVQVAEEARREFFQSEAGRAAKGRAKAPSSKPQQPEEQRLPRMIMAEA